MTSDHEALPGLLMPEATLHRLVTMGCGDACPVYPGKRYLDWQVRAPAGLSLGEVRAIRATSTPACARCSPNCTLPAPRDDRAGSSTARRIHRG